jgi:putative ABC transport system permease protein
MLRDICYSLRALAKSPGFTLVVVVSLAIGIGASSAVFSVVNSLLLRPYNFQSLDRLVLIKEASPGRDPDDARFAPADFYDLLGETKAFESLATFRFHGFELTGTGEPETVEGFVVSPNFFNVIGVGPAQGRAFDPDQDQPGKDRSVVLRYGYWRQQFGGDPGIVGQAITLDGNTFTVTGIMPDGFDYPLGGDFWVPLALTQAEKADRATPLLGVVGRLNNGVSIAQGTASVQQVAARLQAAYPKTDEQEAMRLQRVGEEQYQYTAPLFLTLQGAALFVLLLAVANVTNLLLARTIGRRREVAIRRALGASRMSIARLFVSETAALSCVSAIAALALAYWSAHLIRVGIPRNISKWVAGWNDIKVDTNVLGFALLLAALVSVLFGTAAAFHAWKFDLNKALKETSTGSGSSAGRRRLRRALVVAEVALSFVLLVAAGLMIKGFFSKMTAFQGFQPANVLVLNLDLPKNRYKDTDVRGFFERVTSAISGLPGIESAAAARNIPASNIDNQQAQFTIEGKAWTSESERPRVELQTVSENFFTTLHIAILEGRSLTRLDGDQTQRVAVISHTLARRYWPTEDALGSRIKLGTADSASPWLTIVGVCGDLKQNWWDAATRPIVYVPFAQDPERSMYVIIRTEHGPMQIAPGVREAIQGLDPGLPVQQLQTLEKQVTDSVALLKIIGILMTVFGAMALVLSATGVFSVLAYGVAERTHEFGLRAALGAGPSDILGIVQRETLKLAIGGIALGVPAAFALGSLISGLVIGVGSLDGLTFVGLTLILILVSVLAGYLPARRAAHVDPMVSLRNE